MPGPGGVGEGLPVAQALGDVLPAADHGDVFAVQPHHRRQLAQAIVHSAGVAHRVRREHVIVDRRNPARHAFPSPIVSFVTASPPTLAGVAAGSMRRREDTLWPGRLNARQEYNSALSRASPQPSRLSNSRDRGPGAIRGLSIQGNSARRQERQAPPAPWPRGLFSVLAATLKYNHASV